MVDLFSPKLLGILASCSFSSTRYPEAHNGPNDLWFRFQGLGLESLGIEGLGF